jgi:hypothetical protein
MPQLIKNEHIQRGIDTYKGERDSFTEGLLNKGNLKAEVYQFNDGRYLVKYLLLQRAFLYKNKEELLESIQLD